MKYQGLLLIILIVLAIIALLIWIVPHVHFS